MKKTLLMGVLAIAMLLMATATAFADTVTVNGSGNPLTAVAPVAVSATVNSRLELDITTPGVASQSVEFGNVEPGQLVNATPVTLQVRSNRPYDISSAASGQTAQLGLTTSPIGATAEPRGMNNYSDTYSVNPPWTVAPGAYTATVTYTVVQN